MKRLKLKFRNTVTLNVQPALKHGKQKPILDRLRVQKGTMMQVDHIRAFVDEKLTERCDLMLLGGNVAKGVKYASFQFLD